MLKPKTIDRDTPIWRPYTQHATALEPIAVERAEGATLFTRDGRRIFDAISSWWVNLHGHAHPRIAKAIAAQAQKLEQVIFAGFTHAPAERLATELLAVTPGALNRVFFSDNGATAVEVALKMVVGAWRNRGEHRTTFAALEHAYHGDTVGAMSVSGRGSFTAAYEPLLFPVERLPFPEAGHEQQTLSALEQALSSGKLAGLIVEPLVLGAGGMRMYDAKLLRSMRELCTEHGVPLIVDEVMTGFGRTGRMFACEHAGITPDVMCLSKGITGGFLPLGCTVAGDDLFDAFYSEDPSETLFHGHSYAGNPIACAAAVANLEIFRDEPVMQRIAAIGDLHAERLAALETRPGVRSVRRCGTIAAIELEVDDSGYLSALGPKLSQYYLSNDVLLRPLGNVVYLVPPYCSSAEELNRAYDVIEGSLALVRPR